MTLDASIQVDLPSSGIIVARRGKYRPVYKVLRSYRNEKGRPTNDRIIIGKFDPNTGKLIPNHNYYQYYKPQEARKTLGIQERAQARDRLRGVIEISESTNYNVAIGASFLIGHIMKSLGLKDLLNECLGFKRSRQIQTAALYMAARNNVFESVADFCEGYTLSEASLTSQTTSELFASISPEERISFFKKWSLRQPPGRYLAYDVTSFSTQAEGIIEKEWGYNRDGDKLPQINFGCYVSQSTGLPAFYVTYPGSITDKAHLPYMMAFNEELGIKDVGFVLDRGFRGNANVKYMVKKYLPFILGVEKHHKTTKKAIDFARDNIHSMRYLSSQNVQAMGIHGCFYGVTATMHIYYDTELSERLRRETRQRIELQEAELSKLTELTKAEAKHYSACFSINMAKDGAFTYERDFIKIDKAAENFGFFCVLTTTELDSADTLNKYRHKDIIEKSFKDIKNYIHMKKLRTHSSETTEGKLFCAFIALIIVSEIGTKLNELLWKKGWSKEAVIMEMEKIRVVTSGNGRRLVAPVTKTHRKIFEPFNLTENDLKNYVAEFLK